MKNIESKSKFIIGEDDIFSGEFFFPLFAANSNQGTSQDVVNIKLTNNQHLSAMSGFGQTSAGLAPFLSFLPYSETPIFSRPVDSTIINILKKVGEANVTPSNNKKYGTQEEANDDVNAAILQVHLSTNKGTCNKTGNNDCSNKVHVLPTTTYTTYTSDDIEPEETTMVVHLSDLLPSQVSPLAGIPIAEVSTLVSSTDSLVTTEIAQIFDTTDEPLISAIKIQMKQSEDGNLSQNISLETPIATLNSSSVKNESLELGKTITSTEGAVSSNNGTEVKKPQDHRASMNHLVQDSKTNHNAYDVNITKHRTNDASRENESPPTLYTVPKPGLQLKTTTQVSETTEQTVD